MDERELREAMEAAGRAFADGLAANEEARRRDADARAVAEVRGAALRSAKEVLGRERINNRNRVVSAVASYCSKARADVLDELKNDKRMPRSINYLERYNALLGMDNRSEVLRRLDQTITKAETILAEVEEIDVDAALTQAAAEYSSQVRKLDGLTIPAAEEQIADETIMPPKSLLTRKVASDEDFEKTIEDAFDEAFGALTDEERRHAVAVANRDEHAEDVAAQVLEAVQAAERTAKAALRASAESVAGNAMSMPERPAFDGSAILCAELDVDEVRELAAEVRKSFRTFKQVVQDNGLFAAFASEGTFGACKGWRFGYWWDDFLYDLSEYEGEIPGRTDVSDIPTDIEEDEGGDTVKRSVERMRGFNKKRYWGMLDDEFDEHVEAFWYGFKKLMEGVNGLYRMNPSSFNQYCNDLAEDAKQAILDAGADVVDSHQADELCKEIEKREKERQAI